MARQAKKIDNVHWTTCFPGSSTQAAGSVAQTCGAAQHLPETILRTRGNLLGFMDGGPGPGTLVEVSVGLILVPEGTGTTVLWDPFGDGDAPWFYWSSFVLGNEEPVTDIYPVQGLLSYREVVDSKAMRKIRNREIQFVVTNTTIGIAGNVNVAMSLRILNGN